MIIAMVCDFLGEENNGTTIFCYNLIEWLTRHGHSVNIICPDKDKSDINSCFVVPQKKHLTSIEKRFANQGLVFAKPKRSVIRKAVLGTDGVLIITPFSLGKYVTKYALEHHIPVMATFQCQADSLIRPIRIGSKDKHKKKIYKQFYEQVYKYCQAIHFPSAFLCRDFEKYIGYTPHYIISSGISSDFSKKVSCHRPVDSNFRIIYIARLSKHKNHKVLINAVNMSKYKNRIQLIFAGDGDYKSSIERDACELINQPIIRTYSRPKLLEVIATCDLYVHAANEETEGIACLEAATCGLVPIINNSPNSAAPAYAIDEKNLFNYNEAADLAEKIDYWLDHPKERNERSLEYLDFTKKYSLAESMSAMEKMFKLVIYKQ